MAGIDANLDDLQAAMEASSRAADALQIDTTKFDGRLRAPLLRSVLQHVKDLQSCAQDQRAAMQELRNAVVQLRHELQIAGRMAIRLAPSPGQVRQSLRVRSR